MNQELPDFIEFENEKGQLVQPKVGYEWILVQCNHCKGIRHVTVDCKKSKKVLGRNGWKKGSSRG